MTKQNHNTIRDKLIFYLEGSLSEAEHNEIEAHLDLCADCRALFAELKSTLRILEENQKQSPGSYFYAGVKNRIDARQSTKSFALTRVLQPVLVVFLLVVGIRFGIWIGDQTQADSVQTETAVLVPFDDLSEEPIEQFLLNFE
ncbi:anti-sigma factor [Mangrovibacterium sp.]|uniref:anti-sigma factor family protein n=1 Tax=Mangrovibacterium sp. TaxID=1961364 RepID=UPI0035613867